MAAITYFKMFKYIFIEHNWHNLKCLAGYSATPVRPVKNKLERMLKLFPILKIKIHYQILSMKQLHQR